MGSEMCIRDRIKIAAREDPKMTNNLISPLTTHLNFSTFIPLVYFVKVIFSGGFESD